MNSKKYISLSNLKDIRNKYISLGLCHGVFDILHAGHLAHFQYAKKKADKLVVSLTSDKYVKKGIQKPYNNLEKRLELISALSIVDYVTISDNETPLEIIKNLRPNFYFKGKDYKNKDITGNLIKEEKMVKKFGGKLILTNTELMSSTKIYNNMINKNINNKDIKELKNFSNNKFYEKLSSAIEKAKKQSYFLIGEPIIDEYIFLEPRGVTSKDPAVSLMYKNKKTINGGVLAVAKILSLFSKKITILTYGNQRYLKNSFKDFKNIKIINFDRNLLIQKKTRFLGINRYEKLFQITNFDKNKHNNNFHKNIKKKISSLQINKIFICDYGIDIFNSELINFFRKSKFRIFLNVQTNSINYGRNYFTKHKKYHLISLDEKEWKLGLNLDEINYNYFINFSKKNKNKIFIITRGKNGSALFKNGDLYKADVLTDKVIDTTGCGDAYFAIASILEDNNFPTKFIPMASNIYAGMHAQYFGNEKIISDVEYLKQIKSVINF